MTRKRKTRSDRGRKRKAYREEDKPNEKSQGISAYDSVNLPIRAVSTGTRVSSEIRGWANMARGASRFVR